MPVIAGLLAVLAAAAAAAIYAAASKSAKTNCSPAGKAGDASKDCPLKRAPGGKDLLADPSVNAAMKTAAQESHIGGPNPTEQGGLILSDSKTGALSVERYPHGVGDSISPIISRDGTHNGKEIIASFHTHPNVGGSWNPAPSGPDIAFVKNYPESAGKEHFVVSKDTVYRIGNDGKVSEMGQTPDIFK